MPKGWKPPSTQPRLNEIANQGIWLIITSTHGAGEYPDNIQPFIAALQDPPPKMVTCAMPVIAIGDSSYDTFCAAGKHAISSAARHWCNPITECLTIDVLEHTVPEDAAEIGWKSTSSVF